MLLLEIFNKPLQYKQVTSSPQADTYEFTTGNGNEIKVNVFKIDNFRQAGVDLPGTGIGFDFQNVNASGNPEGITGTGDEFQVFATVLTIVEQALAEHQPTLVAFGAHEGSRQKLYDRMIKVMQRRHAYELLDTPPLMFPLGKSKYYVLRKMDV